VNVCGKAAASKDAVIAACREVANHPGHLRFQDLGIQADAIVISTPEIAGLPYVISGLVAAGGLAAALSTADGLLLALANALSHDIYYKTMSPLPAATRILLSVVAVVAMLLGLDALFAGNVWNATAGLFLGQVKTAAPLLGVSRAIWLWAVIAGVAAIAGVLYRQSDTVGKRLMISRVLLLIVAAYAAATAATRPADIVAMVAWAFSLAAAGIFPALVLGVWWKGTTRAGAIIGMIVGFALCLFYLVITRYWPHIGVQYFGMTSLLNPVSGNPLISAADMARHLANPAVADGPVLASNPLASRVGWFNINNISSALFSLPIGFLTIILVSMFTRKPSEEVQAMVDEARRPKGGTIMRDADAAVVGAH
jgi:Na+(H+)/acetate symporter ActP